MITRIYNRLHAGKLLHFLNYRTSSYYSSKRNFCRVSSVGLLLNGKDVLQKYCNPREICPFEVPTIKIISRSYSSEQSEDDGDEQLTDQSNETHSPSNLGFPVIHSVPAAVVVPEHWAHVPLIAISKNPVFPRFIKLLEVSSLML